MDICSILLTFGLIHGYLVYCMDIWSILRPFEIFYGHLVRLVVIWYTYFSPRFGMLHQEKSGNPDVHVP
jgi:hypothetical protein